MSDRRFYIDGYRQMVAGPGEPPHEADPTDPDLLAAQHRTYKGIRKMAEGMVPDLRPKVPQTDSGKRLLEFLADFDISTVPRPRVAGAAIICAIEAEARDRTLSDVKIRLAHDSRVTTEGRPIGRVLSVEIDDEGNLVAEIEMADEGSARLALGYDGFSAASRRERA